MNMVSAPATKAIADSGAIWNGLFCRGGFRMIGKHQGRNEQVIGESSEG